MMDCIGKAVICAKTQMCFHSQTSLQMSSYIVEFPAGKNPIEMAGHSKYTYI